MVNRATFRVVRDVREWLSGRPEGDDPDGAWLVSEEATACLEVLLEARQNWLNSPDPTLWKTGDVHRLLIDTAPPRLTDLYGLREHGPTVLRALVDFLDDTDRFHPASQRTAALRKELGRAAAKYPLAMADESVWRLAKRIFTTMLTEGVDLADDVAVAAWVDAFNAAPAHRRLAVLGVLLDRQPELLTCHFVVRDSKVAAIRAGMPVPAEFQRPGPETRRDPVYPAVPLTPIGELADSARTSVLLNRMAACGRWAGEGRRVTKLGFPSPEDTRSLAAAARVRIGEGVRDPDDHVGLNRAWRLALDADVLRLHRTEVVAGPVYAALEEALADDFGSRETVELWAEIADIAVSGPALPAGADDRLVKLDEFARPWGPRALDELYRSAKEVDLADLVGKLITDFPVPGRDEEIVSALVGSAVRMGLVAGNEAGAVAVHAPPDDELDSAVRRSAALLGEPAWSVVPIAGVRAGLTPLGRHLVRLNLLEEGTAAPALEPSAMEARRLL
jgi:hypothetical protein